MEPALRQRLIGAVVLIALAVIFVPMLLEGPVLDQGTRELSLELPPEPQPVTQRLRFPVGDQPPAATSEAQLATVDVQSSRPSDAFDTATAPVAAAEANAAAGAKPEAGLPAAATSKPPASSGPAMSTPPPTAAAISPTPAPLLERPNPRHAVALGVYRVIGNADRVIEQLKAQGIPAGREPTTIDGQQLYRLRAGPFATRADAQRAVDAALAIDRTIPARIIDLPSDDREPPPATDAPPLGQQPGWVVQVGSFGERTNAQQLADQLSGAKFPAFVDELLEGDKRSFRVRVGPTVERAGAEKLRIEIRERFGHNGMLRPHP